MLRDAPAHSSERIVPSGTLTLARHADVPDWGELAVAGGYFDQSHLIHDVGELTGTSPVQLVRASEQVKDLHLAERDGVKFFQDPGRERT